MTETINLIVKRVSDIREFINMPRRQHTLMTVHARWLQLCSSLDVIEDAAWAIDAFVAKEFGVGKGAIYLAAYGLLQVLYVQQDAAKHMCRSLGVPFERNQYPKLEEIRGIRNDSTGHPTNRQNGASFHLISQPRLGPKGFELVSMYSDGRTECKQIVFSDLIQDQCREVTEILDTALKILAQDEAEHKRRFAMEKLSFIFPLTLNHDFQLVSEAISSYKPAALGLSGLTIIEEITQRFRAAVGRRDQAYYESINTEYEQIQYMIAKLTEFLQARRNDSTPAIDPMTA